MRHVYQSDNSVLLKYKANASQLVKYFLDEMLYKYIEAA